MNRSLAQRSRYRYQPHHPHPTYPVPFPRVGCQSRWDVEMEQGAQLLSHLNWLRTELILQTSGQVQMVWKMAPRATGRLELSAPHTSIYEALVLSLLSSHTLEERFHSSLHHQLSFHGIHPNPELCEQRHL